MQAVYRLDQYPANFNFLDWLVAAKTEGATAVLLDDSNGYKAKFTKEDLGRRMASIVEPSCALAGLPFKYGGGHGIDPGYHISNVLRVFKKHGRLEKLKTVKDPAKVKYTVTIRDYGRYKERNSDLPAWRRFAEEVGAVVIEDYNTQPIHLHDRMALYAGAEMNFMTGNGPGSLLLYSDYPYCIFNGKVNRAYHKEHGWLDEPLPWAVENQHVVWELDNYENIRRVASGLGIG
jgi:hypothetical protein